MYPSVGAKYPLEVYLAIFISNIPSGIYHYNVKGYTLELLLNRMRSDSGTQNHKPRKV